MRRTVSFIGLAGLAVLTLACGLGSGEKGTGSGGPAGSGGDTRAEAKLGQPVRDGKFEFVAQKVKCGVTKVGTSVLGKTAQGQFCLVTLKVTNIGKEAQSFSDSSQKAYAADGTSYESDSAAALYTNDNADAMFSEINPGNGITAVIVFDIPKTVKITKLELHDSPFSGGVTVAVS